MVFLVPAGKFWVIYLWLSSFCRPWPLFSFLIYTQSVTLLGRGISSSQGRYLHTQQQHEHRTNAYRQPYLELDSNPRSQWTELLGFWTFSIVWNPRKEKTGLFVICKCFSHKVWGDGTYSVGPHRRS
jgi:hypothetical protein